MDSKTLDSFVEIKACKVKQTNSVKPQTVQNGLGISRGKVHLKRKTQKVSYPVDQILPTFWVSEPRACLVRQLKSSILIANLLIEGKKIKQSFHFLQLVKRPVLQWPPLHGSHLTKIKELLAAADAGQACEIFVRLCKEMYSTENNWGWMGPLCALPSTKHVYKRQDEESDQEVRGKWNTAKRWSTFIKVGH